MENEAVRFAVDIRYKILLLGNVYMDLSQTSYTSEMASFRLSKCSTPRVSLLSRKLTTNTIMVSSNARLSRCSKTQGSVKGS
jgi:hypothetical protein